MTITGNSFTVAEIDKAWSRTMDAVARLREGVASAATIELLMGLYLGSTDNTKEDSQRTVSASS